MTKFKCLLAGFALAFGFAGFDAAAVAQNGPVGFDPTTSLQGFPGLDVSLGTPPTTTGSTCASGTLTVVGGASAGKVTTTTCTTLVLKLNWAIPALGAGGVNGVAGGGYSQAAFAPTLTGVFCTAANLTVPAAFTESATTYTAPTATAAGSLTCTFTSATITAGNVILYTAAAF